jgi:hypothetical protein
LLRGDTVFVKTGQRQSLIAREMAAGRLNSLLPRMWMALTRHFFGLASNARSETQFLAEWLKDDMKHQIIAGR